MPGKHPERSGLWRKDGRLRPEYQDQALITPGRREYNQVRPRNPPGYRPPAPEAMMPVTLTYRRGI